MPSVNVISESETNGCMNGETQLIRSHSVGHNLPTAKNPDGLLLNAQFNGLKNGKTNRSSNGIRSTLSQPLLMSAEHESKPLKGSHKIWRSGTLSRPDVFYQVK